MCAQRIHGLGVRHRIARQHRRAEIVPRAHRAHRGQAHSGQARVEAARPAAVGGGRDVVASDVVGQGQVGLALGAYPFRRELQHPYLGRPEMLDDLGTGAGCLAAIEDARRGQAAHWVRMARPPLRALAARLVQLQHAVGLGPAEIEGDAPARDDRPHAVVHAAAPLVLVESEMQPAAQEIPGLGHAARDAVTHRPGDGIGRAAVVGRRRLEEGGNVAPGGEADAQHVRIGGGEHHLIQALGVEAGLEADLRRIGRAGKWIARVAARPCPLAGCNRHLVEHLPALALPAWSPWVAR